MLSVLPDSPDSVPVSPAYPPLDPGAPLDITALLQAALTGDWSVERECDPMGEVSFVVLPIQDTDGTPSFILFEKDGLPRLAMVTDDVWEEEAGFTTWQQTIAALAMAARATTRERAGVAMVGRT